MMELFRRAAQRAHVNVVAMLGSIVSRQRRIIVIAAHAESTQPPRFLDHLHSPAHLSRHLPLTDGM